MINPSLIGLPAHPAFEGLSSAARERLQAQLQPRSFALGDALCQGGLIPAEILLITAGTARLLVRDQGRLCTAD
ncbi:MAG: hypothetical protein WD136_09125, partial [Cyanobium sp.]